MLAPSQEVSHMPTDSLLVAVCVVAMFVVFGAVLFWGDLQTRSRMLRTLPTTNAAPSDRAVLGAGAICRVSAANRSSISDEPDLA